MQYRIYWKWSSWEYWQLSYQVLWYLVVMWECICMSNGSRQNSFQDRKYFGFIPWIDKKRSKYSVRRGSEVYKSWVGLDWLQLKYSSYSFTTKSVYNPSVTFRIVVPFHMSFNSISSIWLINSIIVKLLALTWPNLPFWLALTKCWPTRTRSCSWYYWYFWQNCMQFCMQFISKSCMQFLKRHAAFQNCMQFWSF